MGGTAGDRTRPFPCSIRRMDAARRRRVGEFAVVFLAAGFAEAVRALGLAGNVLVYLFASSAVVLVLWLFLLAG
jgi:hypothetical protein